MDAVVANSGGDTIGILLGYGNGRFADETTFSMGSRSRPLSVAVDDFDKDSRLDVAIANYGTNNIRVLLEYPNGTFAIEEMYSIDSCSGPHSVAVGDLNNDSRPDIVITYDITANVGVLLRNDVGAFKSQIIYPTAFGPFYVVTGDFNNDSRLDIVVGGNGIGIGVFLGYGNGTFITLPTFPTNSSLLSLIVGDFNNDNRLDIVIINDGVRGNNMGVLFGYGNGTFARQITYSSDLSPQSIAVGDFNNDNRLDIVVGGSQIGIAILLGYGNGTFANLTIFSPNSYPILLIVGDFNNDNRLDLFVTYFWSANIRVFFGSGDGTFTSKVIYPLSHETQAVAVRDFNNDHLLDIAFTYTETDYIVICLGYGNGTFAIETTYPTDYGSRPYAVAVADFNNDKELDIVVSNFDTAGISVFLGYGNGGFASRITYPTGFNSQSRLVAVGDFNDDNRPDIVVGNVGTSNIGVFIGYGDDGFVSQVPLSTGSGSRPQAAAIGDFDGKTGLDIVVTNYGTDNVGVLLGHGYGALGNQTAYSTGFGSAPCSVAVGDFDNDTRLDIAVANCGTNTVGVLLGYGNGTFKKQTTYSPNFGYRPCSIVIGDFDNDGFIDIAVANSVSNNVGVLLGYGKGTFASELIFPNTYGSQPFSIAAADFNNDDGLDMVVANYGNNRVDTMVKVC